MGTFNFFREHIPLFSTLAAPLDKLQNATKPFTLNKDELESFNTFKKLLANAPILHFPDFSLLFYVATDASNVGIAAVLYQIVWNEKRRKWKCNTYPLWHNHFKNVNIDTLQHKKNCLPLYLHQQSFIFTSGVDTSCFTQIIVLSHSSAHRRSLTWC